MNYALLPCILTNKDEKYIALFVFLLSASCGFDLPVQVKPSPMYEGGQMHVKLRGMFMQFATALQPPLFSAHSSISASSQIKRRMK